MPEKEILTAIDFKKSNQYTLSIRLSTDGFSFSVRDPFSDGSMFCFYRETDPEASFTANLKQTFRETDFLALPYKQVNVLMAARTTLVPIELFDDDQVEEVFHYNHARKENEVVLYNVLRRCNAVVLFSVNKSTFRLIRERYPAARFYSRIAPLTEYFSVKSRTGDTKRMYAYLNMESIDVFCYERNHILLVNSFSCRTTEDRVYYLLYVWTQLDMDQQQDELYLVGSLKDKYPLLQELQRFIMQVFVLNPDETAPHFSGKGSEKMPFDMRIFSLNE